MMSRSNGVFFALVVAAAIVTGAIGVAASPYVQAQEAASKARAKARVENGAGFESLSGVLRAGSTPPIAAGEATKTQTVRPEASVVKTGTLQVRRVRTAATAAEALKTGAIHVAREPNSFIAPSSAR